MAIFNEAYVEFLLEKKTTEEYHEDVFKKEFNFVPSKEDPNIGTITVDGDKCTVIINKSKTPKGLNVQTGAYTDADRSVIELGKDFFNMKGSHGNERMKAILRHEIGHQKLHNINPDSDTVESKNRTEKVFTYSGGDKKDLPRYMSKAGSKEEQDRRNSDFDKANKYSKTDVNPHTNAKEFEADRYAANRTSERAIRKGISNLNKLEQKDHDKAFSKKVNSNSPSGSSKSERKKYFDSASELLAKNHAKSEEDIKQRSKALKDDDLRKASTYKKDG